MTRLARFGLHFDNHLTATKRRNGFNSTLLKPFFYPFLAGQFVSDLSASRASS